MKRKWIWVILAVLLFIGAFIIFMNTRQRILDKRPFELYDYPESISIVNGTDHRADTLALSLAYHVFDMDTLELFIYYIPEHVNHGEFYYYALVERIPFRDYSFLILLDRSINLTNLFTILSHEFVHIDQYLRGDLQIIGTYAIWKGDILDLGETGYQDRPFEKEAYDRQRNISKKLKDILYK